MTELRFDGRVVVVTGAGRGVGRSHALLLSGKGARVVVADYGVGIDSVGSTPAPAEDVVAEINAAGGDAVACYASVADERGAKSMVDTAIGAFGRVDAVVNNAGVHDPGLFDALFVEQFRRMLDVHFFGTSMPPDLCAPVAAFLAHESCPLNGEVLLIGMGNVSRIAVVRSQGIFKSALSAEDIAENLDQIVDLSDAQVTESNRSVL
jgi:NAD(P)-dependent dehydrogenase (short-subunit alcohol dehydrogenase family)